MTLDDACDRYLTHLQVERNVSTCTVEGYGHDLRALRAFLQTARVLQITQVTPLHLEKWMQSQSRRGLKAASLRRCRSAARQLFVYLVRERHLATSPAAELEGPPAPRRLPKILAEPEAERVVEAPGEDSPRGLRDRAMLELLYGSGLRASEVCLLRMDDVSIGAGLVRPRGKGDKERLVPLGAPSCVALQAYLERGRPDLLHGHPSPYVFIGHRGRPISRMGLFKIVRRNGVTAGVAKPLSPHILRHAFATHLVRGGADLRAVQQMLGHASISTTEIYTHVAREDLRSAVDTHHPLGKVSSGEPKD